MVVMLGFALCVLTEIVSDIQKLGCEFVGKLSPLVWQGTVYHQPLKESYVGEARPGWVYNKYEKIIQCIKKNTQNPEGFLKSSVIRTH